ncbi:hypothetical protein Droror1_Dr00007841, partial [Drosera rotundifolia]
MMTLRRFTARRLVSPYAAAASSHLLGECPAPPPSPASVANQSFSSRSALHGPSAWLHFDRDNSTN